MWLTRLRVVGVLYLTSLVLSFPVAAFAQKKPASIAPAEKREDGWDEIDERLVFLMIRLANTETSLEAVEKAIDASSRKQSIRSADAKRSEKENELMDRKGGGPVKWSVFYGTTAEKFFYHPTDRNSTYHTVTVLTPQPPQNDNQTSSGVPSRQGLPVHQRPPQFDYIYRANEASKDRAEAEAAQLRNKVEALQERRRKLESEQSGLWCDIAFRAVAHYDLPKKPLYRFEPVTGPSTAERQQAEVLKSAAIFMRLALSLIDAAQTDQFTTFRRIKTTVSTARTQLDDVWLRQGVDVSDRKISVGKFAALAKRLEDVASNLSESYLVAVEGDQNQDRLRKDTFRGLFQESLVSYAQIVLALDEMCTLMGTEWKIVSDLDKPLVIAGISPTDTAVSTGRIDLVAPVDVDRDAVFGRWAHRNGELSVSPSTGPSRIQLPTVPPPEYELRVVIVPEKANSEFTVGLVAEGRQFQVILDGVTGISGLDAVDGAIYRKNETAFQGPVLKLGQPNTIVCAVRAGRITVDCNEKTIVDYRGRLDRLSLREDWKVPKSNALFLGIYGKAVVVHRAELNLVSTTESAK